ncbi:putative RNA-directed DNA polymerase [Rosa chinensis]|uniref:Putative RNA-directed DNA polymerase n=1 Tax=Rosa chinensis TaxID=74649 RepID=A0A2P6R896_ROSCH|nr:putative RNA-directed DNA polymerase [Rosa chinensis]
MTVHSDVWGPAKYSTMSGAKYFVTFIDECTRMTWVMLMKNKWELCQAFQAFHKMVSSQYQRKIQVLQSDNGGEYTSNAMAEFCQSQGIRHQTSCAYTPQQNGLAERKNRQLLEVLRASLFGMNVPREYWGEALKSATYLINRTPSSVINFETPQQKLGTLISAPTLPNLEPRVFGCVAYVHIPKHLRHKLDPCAKRCLFVGYAEFKKGYRCYDPQTKTLHVSLDVSFHENEAYFTGKAHEPSLQGEKRYIEENSQDIFSEIEEVEERLVQQILFNPPKEGTNLSHSTPAAPANPEGFDPPIILNQSDRLIEQTEEEAELPPSTPMHEDTSRETHPQVNPCQEVDLHNPIESNHSSTPRRPVEPRYPQRSNKGIPRKQYEPDLRTKAKYPIANHVSTHRLSESYALTVNQLSTVAIPRTVQEALDDPKWRIAMNEEMEALQKNDTWEIAPLPQGKKTIGCRWIYTVKLKADGSIDRYKARLVAKGYTQKYGVDYQETFAPVAKINTIRILMSLAATYDWPLQQYDVKNAFLHGDLEEEVYMDMPPGSQCKLSEVGKVCRLRKSLYGLKQSPRAWFGRFTKAMKAFGYRQSNSDHTLFIRHKAGKLTVLIVYVDDMVVTGDDPVERKALQDYLATEFEMKDLGQLKYFLGIEVARSKEGISLSQRKYVLDLLTETGMLDCQPVETPMEMNHRLGEWKDQVPTNKSRYQCLVGKLIYLSHTRPDIAYAVGVVSQFMHAPSEDHMNAVYRILRYLKAAPGKGLLFAKKDKLIVEGYTDADWAGSKVDRRSTSGYFTFVGGNLVTWRSKKQKVVARSSAEAEFRGMAHGVCELLWIRHLLKDLGFKNRKTMDLHCDNKAAIEIAHNPVQHDRTKHVEVDRHFIKENLDRKIIYFPFVQSEEQLADILTKAVSGKVFNSSLDKLGMIDIYAPT